MANAPELDLSAEAGGAGGINEDAVITPALKTPDITPAQIVGLVPVIASLLRAFGVFDLSPDQEDALNQAVTAGLALFGADAVIRVGRALRSR